MKNKLLVTLMGVAALMGSTIAQSKTVETIEHFGVYVVAKSGYVKLEPYNHPGKYVDFKYLNELPSVMRADESLKLIVYKNDFDENGLILELRSLQTTVDVQTIKFNIKPLAKEGMYELTTDQTVSSGIVLQAKSGNFWQADMAAIVLGDAEKTLVEYFSRKDLTDAHAVKLYLADALKAYPDNSTLKGLVKYWDGKAEKQKAEKTYAYVEKAWGKFQGTKKIKLQVRYLKSLIGEINGYLSQHSKGEKAKEAKERKAFAEKKLEELQQML